MTAPVVNVDVYQGRLSKQWRWRAKSAGNSRIVASSGESFHNRQDCLDSIGLVFGPATVVYKRERELGNELIRHPEEWPAA